MTMIASTLLVSKQIRFLMSKDLGFDKEHVLVVNLTEDIQSKHEAFVNEVRSMKGVVNLALCREALGTGQPSTYIVPEGFPPDQIEIRMFRVSPDFAATYSLQMVSGRFFEPYRSSDSAALIINEELVRRLNWSDPLSKTIKFNEGGEAYPVIGVVKDFNYSSLHKAIEPLVMWIQPTNLSHLSIRFTGNPAELLESLSGSWKKYEARYPFDYFFVDQAFAKAYQSETKLFQTVIVFSVISLIIACLGLYGLTSFTIEQRSKEIGIRKVFGATVAGLTFLVNRRFMALLFIASGVAMPVAFELVSPWLQFFAFRIQLTVWPFVISFVITFVITILAVSIQALRAASTNPVKVLHND